MQKAKHFKLTTLNSQLRVWGEEDSNLRRLSQQIYSLPRLTASVSPPIFNILRTLSQQRDSNPRPADYKSAALAN